MKKFISMSLAMLMLLTAPCVSAEVMDLCMENMKDQTLEISGSGLLPNERVLLEVVGIDETGNAAYNSPDVVLSVNSDDSGSYAVTIALPSRVKTGNKRITAVSELGKRASTDKEFYSKTDIEYILGNWNNAVKTKDTSKMDNVINSEVALGMILNPKDSSLVKKLSEELNKVDKAKLSSELITLGEAEMISDFSDDFQKLYIDFALNNTSDELCANLIEEFSDSVIEKNDVYTDLIEPMTKEERLAVYKEAASKRKGTLDKEALSGILSESALMREFKKISYFKNVKPFVEKYNDYFEIDFSDYNKLSDTYSVDSNAINLKNSYNSFKQYRELFDKWVKEQKTAEKKQSEFGSGKGGAGGGGGTRKNSTAPIYDEVPIIPVQEDVFTDLDGCEWAREQIMQLYNAGVVSGVGNKMFSPFETVKREQFVKMIFALTELPGETETEKFTDVASGEWYESYVYGARAIGVVQGKGDGSFGVGEEITRQDAAVICLNIIKLERPELLESLEVSALGYTDKGDVSPYAVYAVTALSKLGVLNGDDGRILPLNHATRAEAAVIIGRLAGLLK